MIRKLLCALILSLFSYSTFTAQIDFNSYASYFDLPKSPETAMLYNFQETPVHLYTGTPNISVPLVDYSFAGYPVNFSLAYHPNGLRVNEVPEACGLGWHLNGIASITRIPRGLIDERQSPEGFLDYNNYIDHATVVQNINNEDWIFLEQAELNCLDLLPDVYSVNLPGKSFQFTFDWNVDVP